MVKVKVSLVISLICITFLAVGIPFFIIGNSNVKEYKLFEETAKQTQAQVVGFSQRKQMMQHGTAIHTTIFVAYEVDGVKYKEELGYSDGKLEAGDTVDILYDPEDPTRIFYPKKNSMFVIFFTLGKLFLAVGVLGVVSSLLLGVVLLRMKRETVPPKAPPPPHLMK